MLYFVRDDDLWAFATQDGRETRLTDLQDRRGQLTSINLETDGRYVYFTWVETEGDIWVADFLVNEGSGD